MALKKLDNRIVQTIKNGVESKHRSIFFIVGEKARDQIVYLHHILSKAQLKAKPSVLWCYKSELGFSSHRIKKIKKISKQLNSGINSVDETNIFDSFISTTKIRYVYYKESSKILGSTFGMLVLQDFEAITPNLLARTIETVEGGGIICIILNSISDIKQMYTASMDAHKRFKTQAHSVIVPRFNKRFFLSIQSCKNIVAIDDQLNVLPPFTKELQTEKIKNVAETKDSDIKSLMETFSGVIPHQYLLKCCKTLDQAKALLVYIEYLNMKNTNCIVSLTSSRGRGKSACLGLAIAASVSYGFTNIFVTSSSLESIQTLFQFIIIGFKALEMHEHIDYEVLHSKSSDLNLITQISIKKSHKQLVKFVEPVNYQVLHFADVVVIDEAASIPLPQVKKILENSRIVFLASTTHGYEGTGRALSLKLLNQLKEKSGDYQYKELVLNEPIRYAYNCPIEEWLNNLLCLGSFNSTTVSPSMIGCYPVNKCCLYYINRNILFSYHELSEIILNELVNVYVSAHYKNSPNDLQLLADAPAHHLFCLLPPLNPMVSRNEIPTVLCVIQVALEGEVSKEAISDILNQGKKMHGDLLPWIISRQFCDNNFAELKGARIVRIATHTNYMNMGYGSYSLELLLKYLESSCSNADIELDSGSKNKIEYSISNSEDKNTNEVNHEEPLMMKLEMCPIKNLNYIGVSFGLTENLFKFWKKNSFFPLYISQTENDVTSENTCIMAYEFKNTRNLQGEWISSYFEDFRKRFVQLLSFNLKKISCVLALSVLENYPKYTNETAESNKNFTKKKTLSKEELQLHFSSYDIQRLGVYIDSLVDHHIILDLIPKLSYIYFLNMFGQTWRFSAVQTAIFLAIGLQHKTLDEIEKELNLPKVQLISLFNRILKKLYLLIINIMDGKDLSNVEADSNVL